MLYTINNNIKFRDNDGSIWIENAEESEIILTITTARLLSLLLSRHGEVVSRDNILSQVWDFYGLRSSNNSLNKYISDLRRVFRNLGLEDEVIVTIPRVGFMFTESIPVDKVAFKSLSKNAETETEDDAEPEPEAETEIGTGSETDTGVDADAAIQSDVKPKGRTHSKLILSLSLITVLIVVIFSQILKYNVKNNNSEPLGKQKSYFYGKLNDCQAFGFNYKSPESSQPQLSIIKQFMETQKLSCSSGGKIYFQISDPVLYGNPGRVFVSICQNDRDANGKLSSCYNFYEKAYVPQK